MSMLSRTVFTVLVSGLFLLAHLTTGHAQVRSREIVPIGRDGSAPEGRGCYWANRRGTCRAYCYIEVDGRRFCRERSWFAYPQAPAMDVISEPTGLLK